MLMSLFLDALEREVADLHRNQVRLRFIGERAVSGCGLQARIAAAEELTAANGGLRLQVALSYGGRWDIVQAAQQLARGVAAARCGRRTSARSASRPGWRSQVCRDPIC